MAMLAESPRYSSAGVSCVTRLHLENKSVFPTPSPYFTGIYP